MLWGLALLKKLLLLTSLVFLEGCARLIPDPTRAGETAHAPGEEWVPCYSNWYCEERLQPKETPATLNINENTDIGSLLDVALRNHPLTKEAWYQARSSAYQVGVVESAYYPTVTYAWDWVWNKTNSTSSQTTTTTQPPPNTPVTPAQATVTFLPAETKFLYEQVLASYLLFDFGGRSASTESARQALYAANWSQNRTIQQVLINVIQGYYQYVSAKEQVLAIESDLKNAQAGLDSAQHLFHAGVGKYLDVLQAKSNVENVDLNLIRARGQISITLAELSTALGVPPLQKINTASLPETFPLQAIDISVEKLMDQAKRYRPDLAAAWSTMLQKEQDITVALSAGLPNVSATYIGTRTKYIWNSNTEFYQNTAVIQLTVPLFQGFYYINGVKKAREDYKAARANYENLENNALANVVIAYTNYITAKEALVSSEESLKSSQEARNLAYGSYGAGTASFLDLLQADSALALAKSRNIDARTGLAIAIFNIGFATGTLDVSTVTQTISERKRERNENSQ